MNAEEMLKALLSLKEQGNDLSKIGFVAQTDTWISLYPGTLHQDKDGSKAVLMSWQPLPGNRDYQPIE